MADDNKEFYGVVPDNWGPDGDPVFVVGEDDYLHGAAQKANVHYKFNDERINQAIRRSNYKRGLSFWLQHEDNPNRKFKFVKPSRPPKPESESQDKTEEQVTVETPPVDDGTFDLHDFVEVLDALGEHTHVDYSFVEMSDPTKHILCITYPDHEDAEAAYLTLESVLESRSFEELETAVGELFDSIGDVWVGDDVDEPHLAIELE